MTKKELRAERLNFIRRLVLDPKLSDGERLAILDEYTVLMTEHGDLLCPTAPDLCIVPEWRGEFDSIFAAEPRRN